MTTTEPIENQNSAEPQAKPQNEDQPVVPNKLRRSVLVDKLSRISKNVIIRRKKGKKRGSYDENEFGDLPPPDYYYQIDETAFDIEDFSDTLDENEQLGFTPVGRNAVEMGSRFYVERNLFSYLANTKIPNENNYYDEDEVDLSCITQKPLSYIILGKPGIGRTTLAKRLSAKLNTVHICPEEVIEYYRFQDVIHHLRVNEVLDAGGSINDNVVASLVEARVQELDVLHRGYVLDGFPMVTSEELPIEEQIDILQNLSMVPQYVILLNMQDVDLYKRRIEQKYDPDTSDIYIRNHYSKFDADQNVFPTHKNTNNPHNGVRSPVSDVADISDFSDSLASVRSGKKEPGAGYSEGDDDEDPLDGTRDFVPLAPDILFRLITRTEDNPVLVNDDLEQFRFNLQAIQAYVEIFDKRKVLELDAYWAPSVLYKRTWEFLEASGVCPVSIPTQIMRPYDMSVFRTSDSGEFWGEDDDSEAPCPEDEPPTEIDWESVIRAVSVRGLVDPRFRWRISKWYNLCPVALKYGKSIVGKPELATSFLDKVWFLSTPEAVEQFIFNPRPYLLPKMPTSPIKFFVFGHPLAGKTTFSKELAFLTNSTVVDMNREMEKRYSQVVHDFLYKKRLRYTLEAKLVVDSDNHKAWKRLERARRAAMHKWVEEFIRSLAEEEIRAALDADRLRRKTERVQLRKEAEFHKLEYPFTMTSGMCQRDESLVKFCWKSFVKSVHDGKTSWTHQELLELAWDLFHDRKLYYKLFKRDGAKLTMFGDIDEEEEEFGLVSDVFGGSSSDESETEELGEFEEERSDRSTKKKRRKKRRCRKIHIKAEGQEETAIEEEPESSDLDPNDNEFEESIRMRYPMIPTELVDLVPPPTLVPDHNPAVEDIVNRKLVDDEQYVLTLPVELYIEVLRRACSEAESKYRRNNTHGPLSGGWIVENLMPDIEKFRGILRTPEVCPDSVMLLLDRSDNHVNIYGRLKKMFRLKNPPSKANEAEMVGEGGFMFDEPGEDIDLPDELVQPPTTAEFYRSLLPVDNLIDTIKDSPSNLIQKMMDLHREQTPTNSENADDTDGFLTQHERFILEQVRSKMVTQESSRSYESDESAEALKRHIAAEMKSTVHEMSVYFGGESTSNLSTGEQLKEDVRVISEYMRHSRELGSLSYSQEIELDQVKQESAEPDSGMTSAHSIPGEDGDETAIKGQNDEDVSTPDGLHSATTLTDSKTLCPEDLTLDEQEKCMREQQKLKIESPKRRFFIQIRLFDEFWNMAIPVCNEQGVIYSEMGMADEANAREKALAFWDQLESRFELRVKRISENELREEDEEIHESLMKWSQPYEHNNPQGIPISRESTAGGMKTNKEQGSDDDDFSEEDESEEEDLREDRDILASLEGKPDVYWKTLKKIEDQRCFGDMKYYCPVTFLELNVLRKGFSQYACKYRDRLYYCADDECQTKFVKTPLMYLPIGQPKVLPPPRICLTGSPGCGQDEVGVKMAKEYNICYVNFRQRMHELMKARFGRQIGPEKTGEIVSRSDSEKLIDNCKSEDDMLNNGGGDQVEQEDEIIESEEEQTDQEEEEEENEDEPPEKAPTQSKPKSQTLYPSILYPIDDDEASANEVALESLGLLNVAKINTVPIGSIERAERLTDRNFKKLTKIECCVQAFLENGIQLPDSVLDEFIAPLWKEAPFDQVGFVLVGFPNTEADVKYLMKNKYYPEFVYLLDCHPLVIRNRLLIQAVDRWHLNNNPSGKRKKRISEQDRFKAKALRSSTAISKPTDKKPNQMGFEYQQEGRPVIDEFEKETWTYDDKISSQVTKALKHYHSIYSKGIKAMKQSLNKNQINWMPLNTDLSLIDAKRTLTDNLTPKLKYRSSLFEDIVTLNLREANALLNNHIFEISKFNRWGPVELSQGNSAINLWNAPGVQKVPILYRRYIYFLAEAKNAKLFEENCLNLVNQEAPMNSVPAVVVIMGPPKSGKTALAQRIAHRLGLSYISGTDMIESVVKHAFASQWAEVLNDIEPTILADGPQPMILSEEVLNYIRSGETLPKFLVYRTLDLALMQPKAQYHGVVFDDYPVTEEELQEMLYRGLVPSTVIKLNIEPKEAYQRCDKNRTPDYNYQDLPQEGYDMINFTTAVYEEASETTLFWFQNEVQNLIEVDGTQNIDWIYQKTAQKCKDDKKQMQNYLINVLMERPSTLEGTCPLTSQLPLRLSPEFGFYCPVSLNDTDDLVRVAKITDLSTVVEYKGYVYIFSSAHNAMKFMANPKKYLPPNCKLTPPKEVPVNTLLTSHQFEELKDHWGFADFDPVRFYDANHHYKGLQRGDPKLCTAYRNKLYCFINNENMQKFMKKPERYWNQILPAKVPRKTEPMDMEKITAYSYLIAKGILSEIKKVLQVTGEKRPRVPFMSSERCAALFMGYYFKAQNMNAPYDVRQKYRTAMFDMMTTKNDTKKFLNELKDYYGCRMKTLPERLRTKLDDFIKMEHKKEEERVLVPTIPGTALSKVGINVSLTAFEISERYQRTKELLIQADLIEKMEAFGMLSKRKEAVALQAEREMTMAPNSKAKIGSSK